MDSSDDLVFIDIDQPGREKETAWLKACAPVLVQPTHDIAQGHGLVRVFYRFEQDSRGECLCELILVYEGEASYRRFLPTRMNHLATFFYMSFNSLLYKRTADINYLTIRGVEFDWLEKKCVPWTSIRTRDYCGSQTWSQGHRANLGSWLTLFLHYGADLPRMSFEMSRGSDRPLVYVNTANHLMGDQCNNPGLPAKHLCVYELAPGGSDEAELFARTMVPWKCTLFNVWTRCTPWAQQKAFRFAQMGQDSSALAHPV